MHAPRVLAALVFALVLPATLPAAADEPVSEAALDLALREIRAIREADHVVLGRVVRVHETPGVWCGTAVTRQDVTYSVDRTIAGDSLEGSVRVGHLLVYGSPLVSDSGPFLRPALFPQGARVLLLLRRAEGNLIVLDEAYGARMLDMPARPHPETVALCRLVLDLPALQPYLHPEVSERVPVVIALNASVPLPMALRKHGRDVSFVPAELADRHPCLSIEIVEQGAESARLRLSYAIEGVHGEIECGRVDGTWAVTSTSIAEQ